ncbi:MAG TPA: glycosyltransferase family 39 protein [Anaerolineae bacterium]
MASYRFQRLPITSLAGHRILLSIILIIYMGLSLYQINLPGLHYDEAFEAVPAVQLLQGQPVTAFRDSGLSVGGQRYPYMTQDYIGALNIYAVLPFVLVFGSTPAALRIMSILLGTLTLGLTYMLVKTLTANSLTSLAAALLLAVDPTFVFWNRQGIFVTAITAPIGLSVAYCWLRRWQTGSKRWAFGGAFLFGLGLYAKLLFLWLILAMVGAVMMLNLPWLLKQRHNLIKPGLSRKGDFAGAILAFLLGCWPLIAYNVQTGGTFASITQNAATSYYGVNNLAFGTNLVERLRQFIVLLNGSHLWYLGKIISNPLPALAFGLVLIGLILIGFISTRNNGPDDPQPDSFSTPLLKMVLFPFLVIGFVIVASIGTVSALWITHFALLMPWPVLALTTGTWFILTEGPNLSLLAPSPKRRQACLNIVRYVSWVGLGLLVVTNLNSVIGYHRALSVSGGLGAHSDAVYDLTEWLTANAPGPVVTMDWGLSAPITYLTNGHTASTEVFGYGWEADADLANRLAGFVEDERTLYLWRAPDEIIFDRSAEFKALYRPLKLEENIEAAFYERSGRPVLGVTRLVEQGTAQNPP